MRKLLVAFVGIVLVINLIGVSCEVFDAVMKDDVKETVTTVYME